MSFVKITRVIKSETIEISQGSSKAIALNSDSYIRFKGNVGYTLNFDSVNIR
jgi:hypothetical protein